MSSKDWEKLEHDEAMHEVDSLVQDAAVMTGVGLAAVIAAAPVAGVVGIVAAAAKAIANGNRRREERDND